MSLKNKLLTVTRGIIPYVKELRPKVKSVTSCILMQQLDYWFAKYPNGFPKCLEPSKEDSGDKQPASWVEELGFSAEEFKTAFANIGVSYKSKTEFQQAVNKFHHKEINEEKFYCSYFDRQLRLTFYFRNHKLVDQFLDSLIQETNNSNLLETDNPGLLENYKYSPRNQQSRFLETDNPGLQKPTNPVSPFKGFKEIKEKIKEEIREEKEEFVEQKFDTSSPLRQQPISSVFPEEPIQPSPINLEVELSEPAIEEKLIPHTGTVEEKKPLNSHQALLEAFASLFRLNMAIYKGGWPRLAKHVQLFSQAKITAQEVNKFATYWYSEDFRGQKNEPPTLEQVVQKWEVAMEWAEPNLETLVQPTTTIATVKQPQAKPQTKLINNRAIQTQTMIDDVFDAIERKM